MQRKLVKQGQSTLTVALPKNWIKKFELKAGDMVNLEEDSQSVIIYPNVRLNSGEHINISLNHNNYTYLRTLIASWYKNGHKNISITFSSPPKSEEISKITSSFNGVNVFEEDDGSFLFSCSNGSNVEICEKLINKMFQNIRTLIDLLNNSNTEININEFEYLVKTQLLLLRDQTLREISISMYGKDKCFDYYDFVTILEKFGAELLYVARNFNSNFLDYEQIQNYQEIFNMINSIFRTYKKNDFNDASKLCNKIVLLEKEFFNSKDNFQNPHYAIMLRYLRQLASRLLSLSLSESK